MHEYVERFWGVQTDPLLSRKDRQAGSYQALIPALLVNDIGAYGISEALQRKADLLVQDLIRLDEQIGRTSFYLNFLLIRSESISSSWIEGNQVSPKALAVAESLKSGKSVALKVMRNVQVTVSAVEEIGDSAQPVSIAQLEDLHRQIQPKDKPGVRTEQNWVGGSGWSPLRADFVPPPPEYVPHLLSNLCDFINEQTGNALIVAAIAHAQFETIHPFADGNGRVGRALIQGILRRRGVTANVLIPISAVLAGYSEGYVQGLSSFREIPPRTEAWVEIFLEAVKRGIQKTREFECEIQVIQSESYARLLYHRQEQNKVPVNPRSSSVIRRILDDLPAHPVVVLAEASARYSVSRTAVHRAVTELVAAGVLSVNKDQRGNVTCWSADAILRATVLQERVVRAGGVSTLVRKPKSGPPRP